MNSNIGIIRAGNGCRSVSLRRMQKPSFPVDYYREMTIDQISSSARRAYLIDAGDPESVRCIGHGRHPVVGDRQVIAVESHDRLFISPHCDCVLEYSAEKVRLAGDRPGMGNATVGVKRMAREAIATDGRIESMFRAISLVCSGPGETSPYKSHPLFRIPPPGICLSPDCPDLPQASQHSPIRLCLPPDLRYLFAAAPLSYYTGASIETGDEPYLEAGGKSIDIPAEYREFERWAGKMLSHTFQADCAVRCEARNGNRLPGIDVRALTGYAPEELMLMTMPDRLLVYSETLRSGCRAFSTWHMASYVDPVPSSIELLPFLMRSLSAVYVPRGIRLSEREVVSLSVRNFNAHQAGQTRGDCELADVIVLPSLYDAQTQHWFSDGCPVDATLSGIGAMKNSMGYARSRLTPEICVICNDRSMEKEALILKDLLGDVADVEIRRDLGYNDLLCTFSEGFDVVHYAGHCDRHGLKCRDGHADLSSVNTCNVPVFFLNSCSSYLQGVRLVEKGAACGIATMFRLLDDAALDVCAGFYRMLARGYPIMTACLGARECSVTGKEYLLIGDGFYKVFDGKGSFMPFYRLGRNSFGFTLQCTAPGGDKGLIACTDNGVAIADTGFEMAGLNTDDLLDMGEDPEGMCLYGSGLYDSVSDAARVALSSIRMRKL